MTNGLNDIRNNTLKQIERTESNYKMAFVAAAVVEALFLAGFLLLADLANPLHLLLLITAIATYTIVGAGLFALGLHITRCSLRVITAIETQAKQGL